MSDRPLHILFTPSLREGPWEDGIRETAAAKGLTVGRWGADTADILIADHIPDLKVMEQEPRDWVILADTSAAALTAYSATFHEYPPAGQSLLYASHRLVSAAWLAERGAAVLGQPAMALSLPKLGLVSPRRCEIPADAPGPLAPLLTLYDGLPVRVGAKSVWGPEQFSFPANGEEDGGPSRIDLTGRARMLLHGGHLWLPPGHWRATVRMAINPEGRDAPLKFEWGIFWGVGHDGANDLVSVSEVIEEPGFYTVSLERLWDVPGPALLRVSVTQPLFQGVLEFLDCTVERLPDPAPKLGLETQT